MGIYFWLIQLHNFHVLFVINVHRLRMALLRVVVGQLAIGGARVSYVYVGCNSCFF